MISDQDVWLVWSSAFLLPWLAAFVAFPHYRQPMVWASLCTAPLGLTEPLFVPAYWSPPSLLNLARTTGFDIESAGSPQAASHRDLIIALAARHRLPAVYWAASIGLPNWPVK